MSFTGTLGIGFIISGISLISIGISLAIICKIESDMELEAQK